MAFGQRNRCENGLLDLFLLWHSAVTSGIQNENRPKHTAIEFTEKFVISLRTKPTAS